MLNSCTLPYLNSAVHYSFDFIIIMIGISIAWVKKPPSVVRLGQRFNISYRLNTTNQFYESLFGFHLSSYNINSSNDLRAFCNSSPCPPEMALLSSFREKCCVWHANIHVCNPCSDLVRHFIKCTCMHFKFKATALVHKKAIFPVMEDSEINNAVYGVVNIERTSYKV